MTNSSRERERSDLFNPIAKKSSRQRIIIRQKRHDMRRYVLTRTAQADLDDIWDYTERTWNKDQAERYVRAIREACEALALRRKTGRSAAVFRAGYFQYAVGSHFIFYTLSKGQVVEVIRILHQQMDLASRLKD